MRQRADVHVAACSDHTDSAVDNLHHTAATAPQTLSVSIFYLQHESRRLGLDPFMKNKWEKLFFLLVTSSILPSSADSCPAACFHLINRRPQQRDLRIASWRSAEVLVESREEAPPRLCADGVWVNHPATETQKDHEETTLTENRPEQMQRRRAVKTQPLKSQNNRRGLQSDYRRTSRFTPEGGAPLRHCLRTK